MITASTLIVRHLTAAGGQATLQELLDTIPRSPSAIYKAVRELEYFSTIDKTGRGPRTTTIRLIPRSTA